MLTKKKGYFGEYGGLFLPEMLIKPLLELESEYLKLKNDQDFRKEFEYLLKDFVGRPTPLYFAKRLTDHLNGAKIYLKREDLSHTGSHKINNTIGQGLLAKHMGKVRLVAETGAGQHGVATATVASLLGMKCVIYMGSIDIERQHLNVVRMQILGAEVRPVNSGLKSLKDAVSEAIGYFVQNLSDSHYVLGSAVGPHPYPSIVRDFQEIIGIEAKNQILEKIGRLPNELVACIGGGSNSMGLFNAFLEDKEVKITVVEGGGTSLNLGEHAARFATGRPGVFHGNKTYFLQDDNGNIANTHSISAGLNYPGVGPQHAHLHDIGRAQYTYATDQEAVDAAFMLGKLEGILPALESAHAVAYAIKAAPKLPKDHVILVGLSGRGDKDVKTLSKYLEN